MAGSGYRSHNPVTGNDGFRTKSNRIASILHDAQGPTIATRPAEDIMRRQVRRLIGPLLALLVLASPMGVAAQTTLPQSVERTSIAPATPAPAPAVPSLREVITDAIGDFRHVPTWHNLGILTTGAIGAASAWAADGDISLAMSSSDRLGSTLRIGEVAGGARTQLAAAIATYTLGRAIGHGRTASIGADLIRAQILTQSMTAAIKLSVGRDRPDGTQYSFPSGHSSVTFATATVLHQNLGWKVGIPAYGLATYVAASRVHDRRHFLSDVAFGAALGIVAGRAVTVGSGDLKFAVAPAPAAGGGAVSFTLVGSR